MKNYFSRALLPIYVVSFIVLSFFSIVSAFDLPKIDTGVIDLLNKYNASVDKYDQLKDVYSTLKDGEVSGLLSNVTKTLDGDFSVLKSYIADLKDDASDKVDEKDSSLLEKIEDKLHDTNETLSLFEGELDRYIK